MDKIFEPLEKENPSNALDIIFESLVNVSQIRKNLVNFVRYLYQVSWIFKPKGLLQ